MLLDLLVVFNMAYLWSLQNLSPLGFQDTAGWALHLSAFRASQAMGAGALAHQCQAQVLFRASWYGCCRQRLLAGPQANGRWPMLLSPRRPRPRGGLCWVWPQQTPLCWDWCGDPCGESVWGSELCKRPFKSLFSAIKCLYSFWSKQFFFLLFLMLLY